MPGRYERSWPEAQLRRKIKSMAKQNSTIDAGSKDTVFVTFGTPNFSQARARYLTSLARFGYTNVKAFEQESEPVAKARAENPEVFSNARGYGYWLWKPYIIESAMADAAPGARIFYTDVAMEMVGSPERLFEVAGEHDICTFRVGGGLRQRFYTKRDAFVQLDADRPDYWDDEMVNGGFLLLRNTPRARHFVQDWKAAMRQVQILSDAPNAQSVENLPEFRTHRHDQSILSILATRHKLPILGDPSQWGGDTRPHERVPGGAAFSERVVAANFGQIFAQHRRRDASWMRRAGRWVKARLKPAMS